MFVYSFLALLFLSAVFNEVFSAPEPIKTNLSDADKKTDSDLWVTIIERKLTQSMAEVNYGVLHNKAGETILSVTHFSNRGSIYNEIRGLINVAGKFINTGFLDNKSELDLKNKKPGGFNSYAFLTNENGAVINNTGHFVNGWELTNKAGGKIINKGVLANFGKINNESKDSLINEGALMNFGSINGDIVNNGELIIVHYDAAKEPMVKLDLNRYPIERLKENGYDKESEKWEKNGALNPNHQEAYSGSISGTGGVQKKGSGTYTLSGTHSYTKGTLVLEGGLKLTGSLNSGVLVEENAAFSGPGIINGDFYNRGVTSGAAIINGNFYGAGVTLSSLTNGAIKIKGWLAFTESHTYECEVNNRQKCNTIVVKGDMKLGGNVKPIVLGRNYRAGKIYKYKIISCGKRIGRFYDIINNYKDTFEMNLDYDTSPTDVYLIIKKISE